MMFTLYVWLTQKFYLCRVDVVLHSPKNKKGMIRIPEFNDDESHPRLWIMMHTHSGTNNYIDVESHITFINTLHVTSQQSVLEETFSLFYISS